MTTSIPFVPAVYEHKARLINVTPSALARSAHLLQLALAREVELYAPDRLTVGVDIYNVEAEAMGCRVRWFDDSSVPALISTAPGPSALRVPDPERDGRMPLFLAAAAFAARQWGHRIPVRGAVSGPFSMACELYGAEYFLMLTIENPSAARSLLEFCAEVTIAFGLAFLRRGANPIVFDSRATPQLASPRVFRSLIAPLYRDLIMPRWKAAGATSIPLIIGGNTTSVLDSLLSCGATQLLCDPPADLTLFRDRCAAANMPFRANVDSRLVHSGPVQAIAHRARQILALCANTPGFLLGCGVVPYDTPPAHVLAIRDALSSSSCGVTVAVPSFPTATPDA